MPQFDTQSLRRALAAEQQDNEYEPLVVLIGETLPTAPYEMDANWNAISRLGTFDGAPVIAYRPRHWHYDTDTDVLSLAFEEEVTASGPLVWFTFEVHAEQFDHAVIVPRDDETFTTDEGAPGPMTVFDATQPLLG
jgi:hypothetical protein